MKKSALALAIAAAIGASGAATADTVLYGSARPSVDWTKFSNSIVIDLNERLQPGTQNQTIKNYGDGYWDVFDNASRLGVRGSEDLGGGLSAIYQFEFGVDMTNGGNFVSNRPKWVGLKGESWGSITLGTQFTPYYNVLGAADVFNMKNTAGAPFFDGKSNRGSSQARCLPVTAQGSLSPAIADTGFAGGCDTSYLGPLRYDNSIMYSTPNWNGLSAQAMLVMNGVDYGDTDTIAVTIDPLSPQYEVDQQGKVVDQNNDGVIDTKDLVTVTPRGTVPNVATTGSAVGQRNNAVDAYDLNIKYENGPWFAGVAFDRLEGANQYVLQYPGGSYFDPDDAQSLWGFALGYNADAWGVNFNYEYQKSTYNAPANVNQAPSATNPIVSQQFVFNNYYLVGRYSFGNNILRAAWGYFNPRDFDKLGIAVNNATIRDTLGITNPATALTASVEGSKVQNVVVGWQYNFSKRTRAWVEWAGRFSDVDMTIQERTLAGPAGQEVLNGGFPYPDTNVVSVGMRHDF